MPEPGLTLDEAKTQVAGLTAPKVTEESIKAKIANVRYLLEGTLTVAIVTMQNGFNVVGVSAPASPSNFVAAIGERFAFENAFRQLWQLEGYLLCDFLHNARIVDKMAASLYGDPKGSAHLDINPKGNAEDKPVDVPSTESQPEAPTITEESNK